MDAAASEFQCQEIGQIEESWLHQRYRGDFRADKACVSIWVRSAATYSAHNAMRHLSARPAQRAMIIQTRYCGRGLRAPPPAATADIAQHHQRTGGVKADPRHLCRSIPQPQRAPHDWPLPPHRSRLLDIEPARTSTDRLWPRQHSEFARSPARAFRATSMPTDTCYKSTELGRITRSRIVNCAPRA